MYLEDDLSSQAPAIEALKQGNVFGALAQVHCALFQQARAARGLQHAPTQPSGPDALFAMGAETASACVQTFIGRGVAWYAVSAVAASSRGFGTLTTLADSGAGCEVPHLLIEALPMGPETLLLYICLQPRVDVVSRQDYLQRYYLTPPPCLPPSASGAAQAGSQAGAREPAATAASPSPAQRLTEQASLPYSYHQLQQRCWQLPGWQHYRSAGLEVNAMGSGLEIFGTLPASDASLEAVAHACQQPMAIWLAYLAEATDASEYDGEQVNGSPAAAVAAAAGPEGPQLQGQQGREQHREELQQRDAALRRLLFRDPAMAAAERLFGAEPMQRLLQVATRQPAVLL